MKTILPKLLKAFTSFALVLFVVTFVAPANGASGDLYLAVKARPGLTIYFVANGGTQSSQVNLFHSSGNGTSRHNADGWYVQKLPAGFDVSRMKTWCATVMAPSNLFEKNVCSRRGNHPIPADGVYRLELKL